MSDTVVGRCQCLFGNGWSRDTRRDVVRVESGDDEEVEVQVIAVNDENGKMIEQNKVHPYVEFNDINGKKVTIINWDNSYWLPEDHKHKVP